MTKIKPTSLEDYTKNSIKFVNYKLFIIIYKDRAFFEHFKAISNQFIKFIKN